MLGDVIELSVVVKDLETAIISIYTQFMSIHVNLSTFFYYLHTPYYAS